MDAAHSPNRISIQHQGPARGAHYDAWRESICGSFCRLDVAPLSSGFIDCRTEIALLHSVAMASPKGTSARFARTRELLNDGCDDFVMISVTRGRVRVTQNSAAVDLAAGQLCLTEMNVVGAADLTEAGAFTTTRFPRASLLQVSPAAETLLARPLGEDAALGAVFDGYFKLCNRLASDLDADGQRLTARHLADLAGLVLGSGAEQSSVMRSRGLSAAQLELLKAYVGRAIGVADLSIESVARANGVSERQVQRLFAHGGLTFSEYVLEQRLDLARRLLLGAPRRKISDVAFSAGFGDLSYFNRAFRRRFGHTPSDLRASELDPR